MYWLAVLFWSKRLFCFIHARSTREILNTGYKPRRPKYPLCHWERSKDSPLNSGQASGACAREVAQGPSLKRAQLLGHHPEFLNKLMCNKLWICTGNLEPQLTSRPVPHTSPCFQDGFSVSWPDPSHHLLSPFASNAALQRGSRSEGSQSTVVPGFWEAQDWVHPPPSPSSAPAAPRVEQVTARASLLPAGPNNYCAPARRLQCACGSPSLTWRCPTEGLTTRSLPGPPCSPLPIPELKTLLLS